MASSGARCSGDSSAGLASGSNRTSSTTGRVVLNARAAIRPALGGVERWATEVLPRLRAIAPQRYITLQPPGALPGGAGQAWGQAWEQLALPLAAARLDAVAIFSPANLAPRLWRRNVVVLHGAAVLRDPDAYTRAYRAWHAHLGVSAARRALKVISVSEFSRAELIQLAGIDPDRLVVIPGGVDSRFRPDADAERVTGKLGLHKPYVLTLGTDSRRKNVSVLTSAARRLAGLGIDLAWAGGARSYLTPSAAGAGLRSLGYVEDEDLPGLYAGALAFVLPSRYEGFGLPCLEAMACGTPVVASNTSALPETCGSAAVLVDPDDATGIADAVVSAVEDDRLRARLRADGLVRAAQFTWDRTALAVDELLTGLGGG